MNSDTQAVPIPNGNDETLLQALRMGDETAFEALVTQYHAPLVRLAMVYTADARLAEEAVQETWIAVLRGLDRFEGRSSLKTWIYSILMNRAKTIAQREGRYVPLPENNSYEPAVPSEQFYPPDDLEHAGEWIALPSNWEDIPEERLISAETLKLIQQEIAALPANQRDVITLRDLELLSAEEVCTLLGITDANQRVLLHRARAKVRRALEMYFAGTL